MFLSLGVLTTKIVFFCDNKICRLPNNIRNTIKVHPIARTIPVISIVIYIKEYDVLKKVCVAGLDPGIYRLRASNPTHSPTVTSLGRGATHMYIYLIINLPLRFSQKRLRSGGCYLHIMLS